MTRILHISMIPIWVMGNKSGMPTTKKMIDYYRRLGNKQLFVYFTSNIKSVEIKKNNGIRQISIPIPYFLSNKNNRMPYAIRNKLLILFILVFRKHELRKVTLKFSPDVIVTHLQISGLVSKVLFTTRKNQFLRLYGTQRTYDFIKKHWYRYPNWENVIPFILKFKGYILVDDGTNSQTLAGMFGVRGDEILFIRNGVDDMQRIDKCKMDAIKNKLKIPKHALTGIHVNRLHYFKNIDMLISFINNVSKDIHWIIIGEGPEAYKLRTLEDMNNVHWLQSVDNAELVNYYSIADFLVNFNMLSTLNNPNYEALRMHLPVFTLDRGYVCEDINRVLISRNTIEELVDEFNGKYFRMISEKNSEFNELIKRITDWEQKNLYTWEERYRLEWSFIMKRINDVEKDC